MENWLFWLILIIVLVVVEVSTTNLVSIWFIASGTLSLILSLFIDNFTIQFAVFVLLGLILLITTKPILNKFIHVKKENTNLDRVVGMVGIVTEQINKYELGEVKVDGKRWSAISNDKIQIGEDVIIDQSEGVKLKVRKKVDKK